MAKVSPETQELLQHLTDQINVILSEKLSQIHRDIQGEFAKHEVTYHRILEAAAQAAPGSDEQSRPVAAYKISSGSDEQSKQAAAYKAHGTIADLDEPIKVPTGHDAAGQETNLAQAPADELPSCLDDESDPEMEPVKSRGPLRAVLGFSKDPDWHLDPTRFRSADIEEEKKNPIAAKARRYIEGPFFSVLTAVVVVSQVAIVGLEVENMAVTFSPDASPWIFAFNVVFVLFYTSEIALRMVGYRRYFWWHYQYGGWNYFDLSLTVVLWVDIILHSANELRFNHGALARVLRSISAFRIIRLVRFTRIIPLMRTHVFFKPVRLLIAAMLVGSGTALWLLFLLFIVVYGFGLVLTYAAAEWLYFHPDADEFEVQQVKFYFGTTVKTMYTLFQAVTGGVSWEIPAQTLSWVGQTYEVLFNAFIFFAFFIFLNMVTGVSCNIASDAAAHDHEEQVASVKAAKEEYLVEMHELFQELDTMSDQAPPGHFSAPDLQAFLKDDRVVAAFARVDLDINDAWRFFNLFDSGDGYISFQEFMEACKKMRGQARASDQQVMYFEMQSITRKMDTLATTMEDLSNVMLVRRSRRQ